jgi:Arc/MetJ-type ribon-helix-helix transcriptional regulator
MTRRNIFLPDDLWNRLQAYAIEQTVKAGKPVSVSEAMRRIIERALDRHERRKP